MQNHTLCFLHKTVDLKVNFADFYATKVRKSYTLRILRKKPALLGQFAQLFIVGAFWHVGDLHFFCKTRKKCAHWGRFSQNYRRKNLMCRSTGRGQTPNKSPIFPKNDPSSIILFKNRRLLKNCANWPSKAPPVQDTEKSVNFWRNTARKLRILRAKCRP